MIKTYGKKRLSGWENLSDVERDIRELNDELADNSRNNYTNDKSWKQVRSEIADKNKKTKHKMSYYAYNRWLNLKTNLEMNS